MYDKIYCNIFNVKVTLFITFIFTARQQKGNVFRRVCLSVYLFTVRSHYTWSHPPPFTVQGSPNLVKLILLGCHCIIEPPPPPYIFKRAHFTPRTVGKRAVGILLECFLVISVNEPLEQITTISIRVCIFSGTAARNPFNFPCISLIAVN